MEYVSIRQSQLYDFRSHDGWLGTEWTVEVFLEVIPTRRWLMVNLPEHRRLSEYRSVTNPTKNKLYPQLKFCLAKSQ